jgi:signal transduction histidine kinase
MKHRPYLSTTAALLDGTDWSRTSLGPMSQWPMSLRSYVSMVMAMPTPAIIFWGPDLTQIYNDGYAQIMGPRHPRYFGAPYRECWPDTYPLIFPWMRRVLDHAEVIEVERELIPVTRLGFEEDAYFTFTFSPLRDDAGRIAGILQPVFEVTDGVLAERRATVLRKLSALPLVAGLWQAALDVLAQDRGDVTEAAICDVDAHGNATLRAAMAAPDAQAPVLAPDRLAGLVAQARAVPGPLEIAGRRVRVASLERPGVGEPGRHLLACTNPRLPWTPAYAQFLEMVAAELSSALKRAEESGAEERQRAYLAGLFMQAPAGIALLRGPQHVFELVNPLYRALIGHRDVQGLPLREALPELAGQPFEAILDRVWRTGRPHVGLAEPARLAREAGGAEEEVFFNYVYQPLQDAEQQREGILVFCYEVTGQVLARQESDRLMAALREEQRRKDEFLAMLAHELRNPLAAVRSASDLLRVASSDARIVEQASGIVSRQVQHLSGLIDDLLDVSRVTRGLVVLASERQDLRAVLLDAVEQVQPLVEAHAQGLVLALGDRQPFVAGDRKRLVQVFANLLNNAARYTPDGGRITLALDVDDGHALVSVADTGIGIAAELLPRVFDLFVQGERNADRAAGGLGIGLALARSLVEMQGGRIEAESAGAGQGSCFRVRLPLLEVPSTQEPRDAATAVREGAVRGRGEPVLIVDDNVDAALMLALQLQFAGYDVDTAHDAGAALAACARRDYLACLLDIGLPDMTGMELAARLKSGQGAFPLLIAVSGYGQETEIRAALAAGFDHYFVKPTSVEQVSRLLRAHADA